MALKSRRENCLVERSSRWRVVWSQSGSISSSQRRTEFQNQTFADEKQGICPASYSHGLIWDISTTISSQRKKRNICIKSLYLSYPLIFPTPQSLSDPLHSHRPLRIQRIRIPIMALLLTVLQPTTLMILQHAMLAAEMALAERAIAHDPLGAVFAVLEGAFQLLGRHAAPDGQGHVQGRGWGEEGGDGSGG